MEESEASPLADPVVRVCWLFCFIDLQKTCPELWNPDGKKVYQWIGFVSSGDVRTK